MAGLAHSSSDVRTELIRVGVTRLIGTKTKFSVSLAFKDPSKVSAHHLNSKNHNLVLS